MFLFNVFSFHLEELPLSFLVRQVYFVCLKNSLFLLHFLMDSIDEYNILGWKIFSLSTLNILFHFVPASKAPSEPSANNQMGSLICDKLLFSCCFQIILLSFTFDNLIIMCPAVAFIFILFETFRLCDSGGLFPSQIWDVFSYNGDP